VPPEALGLALAAAVLHAGWNVLLARARDVRAATTVALAIAVIAGLVLQLEWKVGVAALVAGALGAVVSVIQRINARAFHIDYDVGKPYAFFLGGLRPLIGGAFAIALAFAFDSKMLHLPVPTNNPKSEHLALVVISFLAGFSERFAQDTLASVLPQAGAEPAAHPESSAPRTSPS
jgi:NAD(P)-dependent dehydrogenase (short-subunit alcohol dehydrogenase family)